MKKLSWTMLLAVALLCGCGSGGGSTPTTDAQHHDEADATSSADASDSSDAAAPSDVALAPPWDPSVPLGGDRPAKVLLPDEYDTSRRWPLVVLLHGYSAWATLQDGYFGLSQRRHERGFIAVLPNGTMDDADKRFWNATDACCNFNDKNVDDVQYLSELLAEAKERLAVDPDRVYFLGHSNGGFMSYRMACELGSQITAIASLAGSSFDDAQDCAEDGQVGVLQIHGEADTTVLYNGGQFFGAPYPGAQEVVRRWAERNGCNADPQDGEAIDAERSIGGKETEVQKWSGCDSGTSVELWTIRGGGHIPNLAADVTDRVLDFLWAHSGT